MMGEILNQTLPCIESKENEEIWNNINKNA